MLTKLAASLECGYVVTKVVVMANYHHLKLAAENSRQLGNDTRKHQTGHQGRATADVQLGPRALSSRHGCVSPKQ